MGGLGADTLVVVVVVTTENQAPPNGMRNSSNAHESAEGLGGGGRGEGY